MKMKSVLGKSSTFLISGVLAVAAFFRGPLETRLLGGIFAIWALWMAFALWFSPLLRGAGVIWRKPGAVKKRRRKYEVDFSLELDAPDVAQILLSHVNCRISADIESVFPGATWVWCGDNHEDIVLNGGIGRIKLFGANEYNYADIRIDRKARIECNLLKYVPISGVVGNSANAITNSL